MLRAIAKSLKRGSALAALTLSIFAGQSHAVTIVGTWDPAYGSAFPNLGWNGSVQFYIPNGCLTNEALWGKIVKVGDSCSKDAPDGIPMMLQTGHVNFYQLNPDGQTPDSGFMDFDASAVTNPEDQFFQIRLNALGQIISLDADFNQFVKPTVLTGDGSIWNDPKVTFSLSFLSSNPGSLYSYAKLDCKYLQPGSGQGTAACDSTIYYDVPTSMRFALLGAAVPEPATLGLLVPALGMLAALRRRRGVATA